MPGEVCSGTESASDLSMPNVSSAEVWARLAQNPVDIADATGPRDASPPTRRYNAYGALTSLSSPSVSPPSTARSKKSPVFRRPPTHPKGSDEERLAALCAELQVTPNASPSREEALRSAVAKNGGSVVEARRAVLAESIAKRAKDDAARRSRIASLESLVANEQARVRTIDSSKHEPPPPIVDRHPQRPPSPHHEIRLREGGSPHHEIRLRASLPKEARGGSRYGWITIVGKDGQRNATPSSGAATFSLEVPLEVCTPQPLIVREGAELTSNRRGALAKGTVVRVLSHTIADDGATRAEVEVVGSPDSSPVGRRGGSAPPMQRPSQQPLAECDTPFSRRFYPGEQAERFQHSPVSGRHEQYR